MLSYGLVRFLEKKRLSSKEAINAFLQHKDITSFTAKQQHKASNYIQQHWNEFHSFIDLSIKNGSIKGQAIKLNHHYDEERDRKDKMKEEYESIDTYVQSIMNQVHAHEKALGANIAQLSNTVAFCHLHSIKLGPGQDAISRKKKQEPKFLKLIETGKEHKLIEFLLNRVKDKLN